MKILFTGGGTGGHFYPIIAVAQEINEIARERKLLTPKLFYTGPSPYNERALYENNITFKKSPAGKMRRYFSLLNFFDFFKTGWGILKVIVQIFIIYPDVIFSKGGYASFPTVVAARLFRIPLVIHESDVVPGRVNKWSGKFAIKIAVAYPQTASLFPKVGNVAHTGNPVRKELYTTLPKGAHEYLKLDPNIPTILILSGSQGAATINEIVLGALPRLVEHYQIIHQTGKKHIKQVTGTAEVILEKSEYKERYKPFDFLDTLALRMSAGAAVLIVSRAGSGAIFEIATWGLPSIIIPIPETISHDQRKNAFAYARSGAAVVLEEDNITPMLLISEIDRLIADPALQEKMKEEAKKFASPHAARTIAEALIDIAVAHEK